MKLTVLGKSPAWTDAGGACSGYLVEGSEGRPFLLDCGSGVFGKLRMRRDSGGDFRMAARPSGPQGGRP